MSITEPEPNAIADRRSDPETAMMELLGIDYLERNLRRFMLALCYFGDNAADRRGVLERTTFGNVTINGTAMHAGRMTFRSARSARAVWVSTTESRGSGRSAMRKGSSCNGAGTPSASCAHPSASVATHCSTSSCGYGIAGVRRL